ncbi:hypothetical protein BC939DRAFT_107736 [Gamsiella multidivaricata]|uniref:uncharacterized protein n=1 Tax=Gamsiella multidivaricata TaxID=101098 RepID=UPI00221EACD1|nr:uncharacterized protein BC939DRAFT_107736 [Gamsiella multidivaricata]KAI7826906.1 hypothetical protein BC939DRAFT_107736 [Gamsiella multidivaricata]
MSNMVVPTPSHQETQGPDAGPDQDLLKASTTPVAASSTEEQAISHSVQEETRPALRAEATAEQTTTPTNTQKPEPTTAASEMAITPVPAQTQAPKQVFSLFLTPEQRKKKLEAEGLSTVALSKRGRKPKPKGPTGIAAPPSPHSMITSKPSIDPKSIVDPNISKNGETHPFFQEIKATSQLHVTSSASSSGSDAANGHHANTRRWLNDKPQESPFPLRHQQFHGSETIDVINGVVARLCGINASSPTAPASTVETLHEIAKRSSGNTEHKLCGWYSLRASPDLGITAPQYTVKPRGKDCWTHWGRSTGADTDREQKWRAWSERNHRLQKPTERERQLVSPRNSGASPAEEFESCQRVAANQDLWQRTWATTLLSNARLTPGLESTATDVQLPAADLARVGELWTEKYRPHQGAEVLGNRANTEYLTQWLKGLEVSGWTLNPEEAGAGGNGMAKKTADIIMGTARKRRKRPRRRGGPELDDFIVYDDDDDFESPYDYLSDEDDGFFAAPKPLSSFSRLAYSDTPESAHSGRTLPKKVDIKSNTVLLSGPTGSCKTAAVYACAEESGYEVFEVSPGTRRTGKEVLGLVGEMAENHHVHVVPGKSDVKDDVVSIMGGKSHESPVATPAATPVATSTIQAFFQRSQQNQASQRQQQQQRQQQHQEMSENGDDEYMDESSDVDIDDSDGRHSPAAPPNDTQRTTRSSSSFSSSSVADGGKSSSPAFHEDTLSDLYSLLSTTNPRQSLILLEEVDILFEDDKGFWASIMTLLSKSRRPVVMTCNGESFLTTCYLTCSDIYTIRHQFLIVSTCDTLTTT